MILSSARFCQRGKNCELAFYQDELSKADAFAVQIRYPGHNADKRDAARILKLTKELRKIIRQYLGMKEKK